MGSGGALLRQQKQAKRKIFHSLKEKFLGRGQIRIWGMIKLILLKDILNIN